MPRQKAVKSNVEKLVAVLLKGGSLPPEPSTDELKQLVAALVAALQKAHTWEAQYKELLRIRDNVLRDQAAVREALEREKATNATWLADYHEELDRWKKQAEEQYDGLNKKLNEKDEKIKELVFQRTRAENQVRTLRAVIEHVQQGTVLKERLAGLGLGDVSISS